MESRAKAILLVLAAMTPILLAGCEWANLTAWECKGSLLGTWDATLYLSEADDVTLRIAAEIPGKGSAVRLGGYVYFDRGAYPLDRESRRFSKPDDSWQTHISFLSWMPPGDELGYRWVLVAIYTACEPTYLQGIVFQRECDACINYEEIGSWQAWKEEE